MSDQEGKDQTIHRIREVLSSFPTLRVAYLYGSFLTRDDFRDIDIALFVDEQEMKEDALVYASRVADALGAALEFRYECDVRIINHEPVWFQYEVISSGVVVFVSDEVDRIDFETRVLVEYQDIKPMYDFFDREYLAKT